MKPVWTRTAIRDLTHMREYIAREDPAGARETALKVIDAAERILQFPKRAASAELTELES